MRIGDCGECSQQISLDPGRLQTYYRKELMEKTPEMADFNVSFDAPQQQADQDVNFSDILVNQRNKSNHTSYQVRHSHRGTPGMLPWKPPVNNGHISTNEKAVLCNSKVLDESLTVDRDSITLLPPVDDECQTSFPELGNQGSFNRSDCTCTCNPPVVKISTHTEETSNLHCNEILYQCNCSKTQCSELQKISRTESDGLCTDVRPNKICCCEGNVRSRNISMCDFNITDAHNRRIFVDKQTVPRAKVEQNNNVGELTGKSKLICDKDELNVDVQISSEIQSAEHSTVKQDCACTVQTLPETRSEVVSIINNTSRSNSKDICIASSKNSGISSCQNGYRGISRRTNRTPGEGLLCPKYETPCTNGSFHYTFWTIPDPRNQKLTWNKPPLTVLVVKKLFDDGALTAFLNLVLWLIKTKNMLVYCESSVLEDSILLMDDKFKEIKNKLQIFNGEKDDLTNKVDFIICLGGDGTLLYASSLFQSSVPPVMAFNLGSLGFLTPFHFSNFKEQVSSVLEGNASLLLRYRLKCIVSKKDVCPPTKSSIPRGAKILVFNEVVIDRGQSSYLTNLDLYVEGRLVTTAQGDGIIISTPTGSTAYAMAAGASMVHPSVPAIVITPICPHSLSFRPIVVPAGVEIKVSVAPDSRNPASASFDGRDRQEITQGDSVIITTAQYPVPSVCFKDQMDDWFDSLAECLHWNVRKPQKPLASTPSVTSLDSIDLSN